MLVLLLSAILAKTQNCITVDSARFTNPSGDSITWRLKVYWSANGTKNLRTIVLNGNDTILFTCSEVRGNGNNASGSIIFDNIITTGGSSMLRCKFIRRTGTCDNGTICDSDQNLINNVLPIKFDYITAKNSGNSTLITFKVGAVEGENTITVKYQMVDGSMKKYLIKLPTEVRPGDVWMITINNLTNTYTSKKL